MNDFNKHYRSTGLIVAALILLPLGNPAVKSRTIETPNGSEVRCTEDRDEVSDETLSHWYSVCENYINEGNLDAEIIDTASNRYNCHAYAWHMTEGGAEVWIGSYGGGVECATADEAQWVEDIYWTDGSYYEVTGLTPSEVTSSHASKVNWPLPWDNGGNHSAVTTSDPGYFISKWGLYPLVEHWWSDCPYNSSLLRFYQRYDPNLAVGFEGAWAFHDQEGQLKVAWVSDSERGSKAFEVYGGKKPHSLLKTVVAEGHPKLPHYYEISIESLESSFQVLEVDQDDRRHNGTRIFSLGTPPRFIDDLRTLNESVAIGRISAEEFGSSRPSDGRDEELADIIFYSPRQDFLDAAAQLEAKFLEAFGSSSQFILGVSDSPWECRSVAEHFYQLAINEGQGRKPFLLILGEANEDYESDENVVGTFYSPDSTGSCRWGDCASDAKLVDFDDDGLPDLPWSRVVASSQEEIENCVQTAQDYCDGIFLSSPRCLILDGDLNMYCEPLAQPRAALEDIAQMFQTAGIPLVQLHDSEFSDCSDFHERQNAGIAAIEGGIGEMIGIGRSTNRSILPGYIFQKVYEPIFSMDLLPTPQRILVEFPGCGLGDGDRSNPSYYPSIMKMFLTADPATHCTAVAWLAHMRGGYQSEHLPFALEYFEKRLSGEFRFVQEAYVDAIRELGQARPELIDYLQCAGSFGWPMRIGSQPISVPENDSPKLSHAILSCYPNPSNPQVSLFLELPYPAKVELQIFDITGRSVRALRSGVSYSAGKHKIEWDGTNDRGEALSSGVYFVQYRSGRERASSSVVLIK